MSVTVDPHRTFDVLSASLCGGGQSCELDRSQGARPGRGEPGEEGALAVTAAGRQEPPPPAGSAAEVRRVAEIH